MNSGGTPGRSPLGNSDAPGAAPPPGQASPEHLVGLSHGADHRPGGRLGAGRAVLGQGGPSECGAPARAAVSAPRCRPEGRALWWGGWAPGPSVCRALWPCVRPPRVPLLQQAQAAGLGACPRFLPCLPRVCAVPNRPEGWEIPSGDLLHPVAGDRNVGSVQPCPVPPEPLPGRRRLHLPRPSQRPSLADVHTQRTT